MKLLLSLGPKGVDLDPKAHGAVRSVLAMAGRDGVDIDLDFANQWQVYEVTTNKAFKEDAPRSPANLPLLVRLMDDRDARDALGGVTVPERGARGVGGRSSSVC